MRWEPWSSSLSGLRILRTRLVQPIIHPWYESIKTRCAGWNFLTNCWVSLEQIMSYPLVFPFVFFSGSAGTFTFTDTFIRTFLHSNQWVHFIIYIQWELNPLPYRWYPKNVFTFGIWLVRSVHILIEVEMTTCKLLICICIVLIRHFKNWSI